MFRSWGTIGLSIFIKIEGGRGFSWATSRGMTQLPVRYVRGGLFPPPRRRRLSPHPIYRCGVDQLPIRWVVGSVSYRFCELWGVSPTSPVSCGECQLPVRWVVGSVSYQFGTLEGVFFPHPGEGGSAPTQYTDVEWISYQSGKLWEVSATSPVSCGEYQLPVRWVVGSVTYQSGELWGVSATGPVSCGEYQLPVRWVVGSVSYQSDKLGRVAKVAELSFSKPSSVCAGILIVVDTTTYMFTGYRYIS